MSSTDHCSLPGDSPKKLETWQKLEAFFQDGIGELSDEEQIATTSILHSLNEERYHFVDEQPFAEGGEKLLTKAYDTQTDRIVVIARPKDHSTIKLKENFLREARLTCKLQHPNILPIYEIGLDKDAIPYFVMRLMEGEDLGALLKSDSGGDLDGMLEVFLRICDGVIYAHSCAVLHLDIKPANVMIGKHGETIIHDWGMAQVMIEENMPNRGYLESEMEFSPDQLNRWSHYGILKGTPGYMAPEQIDQNGSENISTDVYALGAILYKMLTGSIPVEGQTASDIIENTRRGRVIRPQSRRSREAVPSSLAAIVMKALSTKQSNRYQSVSELKDEVVRYQRGFSPSAEKANMLKKLQLLVRRHNRVASVMLASLFLVTVLGAGWSVRESVHSSNLLAAKMEAERNLQNFLDQQAVADEYHDELGGLIVSSNFLSALNSYPYGYDFLVQECAKPNLNEEYSKDVHTALAFVELARQKFNRAAELADGNYDRIFRTATRWAEVKPNDDDVLSDQHFAGFMRSLTSYNNFRKLAPLALQLHVEHRTGNDPQAYLPVVLEFFNLINNIPEWGKGLRVEEIEGANHLDLSYSPYNTFVVLGMKDYSFLEPLKLKSINISGMTLHGPFGVIVVGYVETVIMKDILGDNVAEIGRILVNNDFVNLKRLVISEGMFEGNVIEVLQEKFELIVEEPTPGDW